MTGVFGFLLLAAVACGSTSKVSHILDTEQQNGVHQNVARSGIVDFYMILEQAIYQLGERHGTKVVWWDYTGFFAKQEKEYEQYEKNKVAVEAGVVYYDDPVQVSDTEETAGESAYHNYNDATAARKFYFQQQTPQKYTWVPNDALDVYPTPWGHGYLPLELQDPEFLMRVGLGTTISQFHDDETFELEFELDVPPVTKAQVIWKRVQRQVDASWKANITLSGPVAVFFSDPVDGEQLKFYPVHTLAASDGLKQQMTENGPVLLFEASGEFVGTRTLRLDREYYFEPLN